MRSPLRIKWHIAAVLAFVAVLVQVDGRAQSPRARRIAGFGSSVANGTGDEYGKEGYTGMLREMLAEKGWEVLNQSRGGDNTIRMAPRWAPEGTPAPNTRYLLPVHPGYVVIALSLANEGIHEAEGAAAKDAIFQQFASGIKGFVAKARAANIVPVVTLCYPRDQYDLTDYEYVRRMNVLMNSWDVPSVNFLGALDDGTGRWARGFMYNDRHPNASGHQELANAFVPSLFDALEQGKPLPERVNGAQRPGVRITDTTSPIVFTPDSTMRSFAFAISAKTQGDGVIATVQGTTLFAMMEQKQSGAGQNVVAFEEAHLGPEHPFASRLIVQNGDYVYVSADGTKIPSGIDADGQWHDLALSHYVGRGETLFYVDGRLAGSVKERLEPDTFTVGRADSTAAVRRGDYRDLFLFRGALNADEVAVLHQGKLLQASLEVYAPLSETTLKVDQRLENRAQSLSAFRVAAPLPRSTGRTR